MPVCHKCPHYPDVKAGKYDNTEFSKVPCSSCHFTGDHRARHIAGGDVVSFEQHAVHTVPAMAPAQDDSTIPEGKLLRHNVNSRKHRA